MNGLTVPFCAFACSDTSAYLPIAVTPICSRSCLLLAHCSCLLQSSVYSFGHNLYQYGRVLCLRKTTVLPFFRSTYSGRDVLLVQDGRIGDRQTPQEQPPPLTPGRRWKAPLLDLESPSVPSEHWAPVYFAGKSKEEVPLSTQWEFGLTYLEIVT